MRSGWNEGKLEGNWNCYLNWIYIRKIKPICEHWLYHCALNSILVTGMYIQLRYWVVKFPIDDIILHEKKNVVFEWDIFDSKWRDFLFACFSSKLHSPVLKVMSSQLLSNLVLCSSSNLVCSMDEVLIFRTSFNSSFTGLGRSAVVSTDLALESSTRIKLSATSLICSFISKKNK